jgi:hypothetical protein
VRWVRLTLVAAGLAAIGYGAYGSFVEDGQHLAGHLLFLVEVLAAHDLVLIPIVIGVGWLLVRFLPRWARAGVQGGLYASAAVTALAFPFVLGVGELPDNPSKFPLNYARGLLIVLAVIWLTVAALLLRARARTRAPRRTTP